MPTTITPDITQTKVFEDLRAYLLSFDNAIEVVRGLGNRVPAPNAASFIVMSPALNTQLSTPVSTYTDTTRTIQNSMQFSAQVDCYGPDAGDRATAIVALMRTDYSVDKMSAKNPGIVPLYASDPQQIALVDGEQQYEQRWTFNVLMQYNPRMTVAQDTFNSVGDISLINVDVVYPPGV